MRIAAPYTPTRNGMIPPAIKLETVTTVVQGVRQLIVRQEDSDSDSGYLAPRFFFIISFAVFEESKSECKFLDLSPISCYQRE